MHPSRISIRDAVASDSDALTAIAVRSKGHWGYDEQFIRDCLDELTISKKSITKDRIRVAETAGRLQGFIHVLEGDEIGVFEIEAMFVDPPHIGKGIGAALWEDMITYLTHVGARRIEAQADPNAEGFYRSMGMKLVGKRESESIPGRMLPLLSLDL